MSEQTARKLILIVDDTPENLEVLNDILQDEYQVKAAISGEKALKICASDPLPDMILLDVMMPGMDGYEVLARLKADKRTKDIPVMFVTAMSDDADEMRGFSLGAIDYVTKPIRPAVVLQRIHSHLELRAVQRKLEHLGLQYSSYLAPELAESIQCGEIQTQVMNQRKKLTIFFSDIQGFTRQTEKLEPEDMSFLLNSYFEAMNEIIARHGGTLDKYIGDAIMVFFGDPHSKGLEEDAASCISMALEMQMRLDELRRNWTKMGIANALQVRMGIATGYCTVGNFGSRHKLDYTIIGSPVNLAARLETSAEAGTVRISEETWNLAGARFSCLAQPPILVKGFLAPVNSWLVKAPGDANTIRLELTHALIEVRPEMLTESEKLSVREAISMVSERLS